MWNDMIILILYGDVFLWYPRVNPNNNAQNWKQGRPEKLLSAIQICEISA